ncbi:hypothetical protein DS909_07370 [Phaeobacter gallaeciensis]|uniref:Uncharacterized protein n=2 Tax=Roseobacteraceae TaxID=2854170 RepID=A0A366X285_9RHOB|nr:MULTISPECIES: hypothetical protein [Roseobacteraceae]MBT3143307.1 hypothetical protein [Falsiruegeria litorea]MBT8167571.1 hypothetical protein [Falsiruegeria litorea]RBW57956.1 hypothetical protein DS909_07370 [Phaeobacter gallaeciensis]
MTLSRLLLSLGLALTLATGPALAQADYGVQIEGLSVYKNGQVWVYYEINNEADQRVCLPGSRNDPSVFVGQFRASDDAPLTVAPTDEATSDKFRSPYIVLEPGQSLRAHTRYSVHDFSAVEAQTGQAPTPPSLNRDALYVILSMPVRTCPLFTFGSKIAFNLDPVQDQVVRSLPSRVFSLSKPGRY